MTHRVRSLRRLAAALGALALALSPAIGSAQKTVSETAEVVVVEVPVQVVDGGEPVRGLTAANFEVFDGRKKVPVTGFEVLDLASTPAASPVDVPAAARRHFMMLFDLTFSDPISLLRAREAAKEVVKTLHPADLVAVTTYSTMQGPQMVLGFTPDRAQAVAAIDTLGLSKLFNRAPDPLRLVMSTEISRSAGSGAVVSPATGAGAGAEARAQRDEALKAELEKFTAVGSRAERNVDQMIVRSMTQQFADLAKMMGSVDGRKYVVLLSEGFDSSLVTGGGNASAGSNDLRNTVESASSESDASMSAQLDDLGSGADATFGSSRSLNQLEKMLTEFRRADCQIQAVNIGGLRAMANEGRLGGKGRDSLLTLAKDTGGELYENFNDLAGAMGQMLRRTGVTYVLSFQPDNLKRDGEFHKLRVELKNAPRGARVVHRQGYYAPKPYSQQAPMQRLLDTADQVMGEEGGSVDSAVLAAAYAGSGGRAYVPVVVEVDGKTLLAGKQDKQLPLEIYVYGIDEQGAVHDYRTQSLALDLAKAEAQLRQTGLKFFGHLSLPPGKFVVRTLVRNGTTGATGVRVTQLVVPASGTGAPALLPPLFPEAAGRWVMVRETLAQGETQPPYPFMLDGAPFIPASRPVIAPGQPTAVVLQGYNLASGNLAAKVEVVGADGSQHAGGAFELGKASGSGALRVVSGTFKAPSLRPGEYELRVTLTDGAGKTATSTGAFAVAGS